MSDRRTLPEQEAKAVLASAGIPSPERRVVADADAAVEAAGAVGYPVVAKVAAPGVEHKSDWAGGAGVAVGLDTAGAVRDAARAILDAAAERDLEARVLVEAAVDTAAGTEVIVGGLDDEAFGPTLLFGLGGVFTEVLEDVSHRLAPVSEAEARTMLTDVRGAPLLAGYRSRPAADRAALARAVVAVGELVAEEGYREVEVNPLLATADGVLALDALVVE